MNTTAERLTAAGSPFEIVEASVAGVPCKVFRHAPSTLIDVYRRARSCGDREFLVSGVRRTTFKEVFRTSERISRVIRQRLGEVGGAKIAVIFPNVPEWIASFIAVTSMGATAVAIHRALRPRDIAAAIDATDCRMVLCDDEISHALRDDVDGRCIVAIGPEGYAIGDSRPADAADDTDGRCESTIDSSNSVQPESVAMIAFTSGSTSRPKGVELTHRSMTCGMMNALLGGALAATGNADRMRSAKRLAPIPFLAGPFSHVSGYGTALLSLYVGGKIVTMGEWDANGATKLMCAERTTAVIGITSAMLGALLQGDIADLGEFVRSVVVQGAALPQKLLRALKAALPEVSVGVGYGLTETNGVVCMGSEAMLSERPNTSGKPLPTVDVRILRADGTEAAPGQVGEVTIRGAMVMRGYVNLPGATGKVLQDGWFRTGDLGWVDEDRFLYVTDRAGHFFGSGGDKISCSAVAGVILDNELAAEAFAFGVTENGQNERLVLAVSGPKDICADDSAIADALERAGYGSLAPHIMRLRTSLPRTPSGKIDGHELRRQVSLFG